MRESPRVFGDQGEELAVEYLQQRGYRVVEQNYYARKLGEIDIIALKDNTLHFVEVKSGSGGYDPVYNLTPSKLQKVINSAQYYMKVKNLDLAFMIDAIIIRDTKIEYIDNITL